ncbi:MAG: hypothetical protein ABL930_01830 [Pseudobdellovibrio sp.]
MLRERKDIILLVVQAARDISTLTEVYLYMAKKTAPKKKATPAKAKTAKSVKPAKPAKSGSSMVKSASKMIKTIAKALKPSPAKPVKAVKPVKASVEKAPKAAKPALMTKKGKKAEAEEVEVPEVKKTKSVVSMMESDSAPEEAAKVEKTSKVKPVKVDRGNVADEKAKWIEVNKKYGKDKALTYKMTETFTALSPIQHKVLGWGFVLTNENDRLEVLFETGIRMLISNYKS